MLGAAPCVCMWEPPIPFLSPYIASLWAIEGRRVVVAPHPSIRPSIHPPRISFPTEVRLDRVALLLASSPHQLFHQLNQLRQSISHIHSTPLYPVLLCVSYSPPFFWVVAKCCQGFQSNKINSNNGIWPFPSMLDNRKAKVWTADPVNQYHNNINYIYNRYIGSTFSKWCSLILGKTFQSLSTKFTRTNWLGGLNLPNIK